MRKTLFQRNNDMKVKELMTPLSEYSTLTEEAKLSDAIALQTKSKHRDILIIDENGNLKGVLTITDILSALEPSYKKLHAKNINKETLTTQYVADIFKEFGLWANSLSQLCKKGRTINVVDAMYTPEDTEYLNEEDKLEHGLHSYIIGTHQPLMVRSNGSITGILRLSDVFDEVKKRMVACAHEQ
jgi:predicted transcriptional regulator